LDVWSLAIESFFIESFAIVSLDIVSFFMSSATAAGVNGVKVRPAAINADKNILLVMEGILQEVDVTPISLSQRPDTPSSVSRC
jgi:hypothetical protein